MKLVLHSFTYTLNYLREQVADVAAMDMVAQPKGVKNHPAWVIGHLTHSCEMLGGTIGLPPWLPEDWAKCYATGSSPIADAGVYETKERALAMLGDAQSRLRLRSRGWKIRGWMSCFPIRRFSTAFRRSATR